MAKSNLLSRVQQYSRAQLEPAWLLALRTQAVTAALKLPAPRFEKIAYADWSLFESAAPSQTEVAAPMGPLATLGRTQQFYAVGATTIQLTLPIAALRQGVILSDLRSAIRTHGDLVKPYLARTMAVDEDKFGAWNTALMTNGFFLYIPANVQLEEPIEILQLVDQRQPAHVVQRSLLITSSGAHVKVVQRLQSLGTQPTTVHHLVEVVAAANSQVEFAGLDELNTAATAYISRRGVVAPDAQLDWELAEMNAGRIIGDFKTTLNGQGAQATVKTIAVANGQQTQGLNTRVTNVGPQTVAQIVQRGVILAQATLIFNGIGHIVKGAHGAQANQENRLLMLTSTARGDANPILLIDENDVEAGHAASVGRVDEQQLYYLMSRGLPRAVAERLVIRGFLAGVITGLQSSQLQTALMALIERRLTDET
ncbi:Fe-S cluster assembly protein SufD [Lactobacillus sp. CBA3606]|uniref:Fe-S cluster assembly protein SufD n=1 Tax=Lactobacillus sp. CBA3606 TaxID=2099789 RepID=UPI000CFAAB5D|nr:Fe-S cluster assembly protein SufD [Lactobacillus sp. CBA3606]AVK63705.1 Fe-S cluster assembly protein SufD [Lactobacillus sp. CBA3606]